MARLRIDPTSRMPIPGLKASDVLGPEPTPHTETPEPPEAPPLLGNPSVFKRAPAGMETPPLLVLFVTAVVVTSPPSAMFST